MRRICEDEINALDQRVGVLLGDAEPAVGGQPVQPAADLRRLQARPAGRPIESRGARGFLLKLFDDHVLDAIRSIYKAMNDLLVQNRSCRRSATACRRKRAGRRRRPQEAGDAEGEKTRTTRPPSRTSSPRCRTDRGHRGRRRPAASRAAAGGPGGGRRGAAGRGAAGLAHPAAAGRWRRWWRERRRRGRPAGDQIGGKPGRRTSCTS